jgi:O-antigen ligase
MALNHNLSTQKQNPLFYWISLAYLVGMPNFVHFDNTGRTSNPINATSIIFIIQAVFTGYMLVVVLLLERSPVFWRKVKVSGGLWLCLLIDFVVVSILHPASRITAPSATDVLLPLFLLGQWTVAFILFVTLYARTAVDQATEFIGKFIGRACWIWIGMVWFFVPIMPQQAYGASEESTAVRRLGGQLIHPGKLAVLACIGFYYALFFFPKGLRKWAACAIALFTIALTGARTGQLAFILTLFLYAIVYSRKPILKYTAAALVVLGSVAGIVLKDLLLRVVSRGQSLETLASLDDRTRIWQASYEAIRERPFFGYGYSVGARNALRDHWKFVHWIPPHAHNEFIQALLEGGVVAFILIAAIYMMVSWRAIKEARRGQSELFLMLVVVQLLINTISGPLLTYWFAPLGGIFMLCCIATLGSRPFEVRKKSLKREFSIESSEEAGELVSV